MARQTRSSTKAASAGTGNTPPPAGGVPTKPVKKGTASKAAPREKVVAQASLSRKKAEKATSVVKKGQKRVETVSSTPSTAADVSPPQSQPDPATSTSDIPLSAAADVTPSSSTQPGGPSPELDTSSAQAQQSGASAAPQSDSVGTTVAGLHATIASLQAQLSQAATPQQPPNETITPIHKPVGEAGSNGRGFNLRDAMLLSDTLQKQVLYRAILRTVKINCLKYGIDVRMSYRHQDPEVLAKVFKAGCRMHEYLTPRRFPLHWAQACIVKQWLSNTRKYYRRRQHILEQGSSEDSESSVDAVVV